MSHLLRDESPSGNIQGRRLKKPNLVSEGVHTEIGFFFFLGSDVRYISLG